MTGRRVFDGVLDDVRARIRLSDLVGARVEFDPKRSHAARGDWWACCPFHAERTPSFHVLDKRGVYYCFGCHAKGDHVTWAREMLGAGSFPDAVRLLARIAGVDGADGPAPAERAATRRWSRGPMRAGGADGAEAGRVLARAARIWAEAVPDHPLLWSYLAARGVDTDALRAACGGLPPALRLHPALDYWERGRDGPVLRHRGPAMVARVGRHHQGRGLHRTWIAAAGRASEGGETLDKRWLGPVFGHPVCLTAHTRRMIVGEGIETTLACLSHLRGRGERWSAEVALSRGALTGGGLPGLPGEPDFTSRSWAPPDYVDELVVLAEGSSRAPDEARMLTERAVRRHRWRSDGRARACRYALPGGRWDRDLDFADVLAAGAA